MDDNAKRAAFLRAALETLPRSCRLKIVSDGTQAGTRVYVVAAADAFTEANDAVIGELPVSEATWSCVLEGRGVAEATVKVLAARADISDGDQWVKSGGIGPTTETSASRSSAVAWVFDVDEPKPELAIVVMDTENG